MTKKKVSVIIPTYNRARLLKRSIQSVLNQTYQDFEIIIVDDGSNDNIEDVVNSFNNDKIRYIRHGENRGPGAARNTGIELAESDYIAFQDSDDEWLPWKIEKQMQCFEASSPQVGVVYTGLWRVKGNKKFYIPSHRIAKKEGDIHDIICRCNFVAAPTAVVRKECFRKAGMFDEGLPQFEDWELWIRISRYYQFKYVNEPLIISYHTSGSVNEQGVLTEAEATRLILEKHIEEFEKDKRLLAQYRYVIGNLLCQTESIAEGRIFLFNAAKLCPSNLKYLLALFISLFGKNVYSKFARFKRGTWNLKETLYEHSLSNSI